MTDVTPDQVQEALEGTCRSDDEAAQELGITDEQMLELLPKAEVEQCEQCGWWSHIDETEIVDDEVICSDCIANA